MQLRTVMLPSLLTLLVGCSQHIPEKAALTGYFIDAPVTGLYYSTSSNLEGMTNKGAYEYRQGDTVTFYLGQNAQAMPLTKVSPQEITTPYSSSTTPSRTVNMTRLLLSLDSQPASSDEIVLASHLLSQPDFQQKLKTIDLNNLDVTSKDLGIDIVSMETAVTHLAASQQYIQDNFSSDKIIYAPMDKTFVYVSIKRRDYQGKLCYYDTARANEPDYYGPIGRIKYSINSDGIIIHPGTGDYFGSNDGSISSCELNIQYQTIAAESESWQTLDNIPGVIGCARTGCSRSYLNGYKIQSHDDEGDWKYRTIAHSFNETTQLIMESTQGLGKNEHVQHSNHAELLRFTLPDTAPELINMQGIWQLTQYNPDSLEPRQQCLLIKGNRIYQANTQADDCMQLNDINFNKDISKQYADMWWMQQGPTNPTLAQLNTPVKWYDKTEQPHITSWEYLPTGNQWDLGILYRLQQKIVADDFGREQLETIAISELHKLGDRHG
ncbi:chromosome partitioning protein ParA [Photobacterium lipolyticum]|uniref:Chromosome partitioning protein ParA n=1 Tax=Photobacterium lipolyticum TaxID=266810 RepID=A0A2T3N315_9GAMM|nr:chromosome partitioning protein ParA [Photobacterium lipolyticum]PSW06718.1 chromosome partitioning protein ParA [Photobacterium lipolyticum]